MKFETITIEDGETGNPVTFKVAPTPLRVLSTYASTFAAGSTGDPGKLVEAIIECVFAGARRAKQGITLEWLRDNVDAHNQDEIARVFASVNGLAEVPGAEGGATKPGEAQAAGAP